MIKRCAKLCPGRHKHAAVLGSCYYKGRRMNVSEFAGGYTKAFANAMLDGAEEFLSKKMQPESLVQGGEVAEEQFEDVEDENRQDLLRGEDEEQGGARQDLSRGEGEYEEESQDPSRGEGEDKEETQLSKLHRRLGHPSNTTMAKMLSLAGASKEMVRKAENHHCPTCQEIAPPGRYLKQKPETRPVTFGLEVHCDLKYIHDAKQQLFVALSMVDAATSYHAAVLLRNRSATHVAKKFARHWCSIHGVPKMVVLDQGGEFDGGFIAWLEQHGIYTGHC